MNRFVALMLLLCFFAMSAWTCIRAVPNLPASLPAGVVEWDDTGSVAMARGMRDVPYLSTFMPALRAGLGQRLQNGVYVTDTMLIEIFEEPDYVKIGNNTEMLRRLVDMLIDRYAADLDANKYGAKRIPVYLMLVPTAGSIKSQELLPYTYQVDQKQLINTIYYQSDLPGAPNLNSVRAYEALERARDEYIYYRTDSRLTGLGGYYLYQDLLSTMRLTPESLGRFQVTHVDHSYKGALASRAYSNHLKPDLISVYNYIDADIEYRTIHFGEEERRYYDGLFPLHKLRLGEATDVILGGVSPRIDIRSSTPYDETLLILTDRTVQSYIGFLALHFRQITILDINTIDQTQMQDVDVMGYDRILVSLSLDTYAHSDNTLEALELLYYRVIDPALSRPEDLIPLSDEPVAMMDVPAEDGADAHTMTATSPP